MLSVTYYQDDYTKKNVMGGARSARGRGEKLLQTYGGKNRRDHLEELGVDDRITLKWIPKV